MKAQRAMKGAAASAAGSINKMSAVAGHRLFLFDAADLITGRHLTELAGSGAGSVRDFLICLQHVGSGLEESV